MNKFILNFSKFLFFLGIGLGILYLVYRQQDAAFQAQCQIDNIPAEKCSLLRKIADDFRNTNYIWIAVVLLCYNISNLSRAIRWQMLIRPLGYAPRLANSFWTVSLGYFANLGLPRMGEVVRAGTMARYERIPVEKLMGTVVVDRIIDMISLLMVVGLAFLLEFSTLWGWLSTNMKRGNEGNSLLSNPIILSILLMLLIIFIAFVLLRKRIMESPIFAKILKIIKGFAEGLQSIQHVEQPFWLFFHSIIIWLMYYLMAYFCFFAHTPTAHLSALAALMVFVFGAFGIVIPSPGGMGTYHLLVIAALSLYNIKGNDAFSFANIFFFSVNIFCNIIVGVLALILLPILNRKIKTI